MPYDDNPVPALVAAPRHLRRRRFHSEIPDPLLVPDAEPYKGTAPGPGVKASAAKRALAFDFPEAARYRRKRLVALMLVVFVLVSLPVLIALLVLAA